MGAPGALASPLGAAPAAPAALHVQRSPSLSSSYGGSQAGGPPGGTPHWAARPPSSPALSAQGLASRQGSGRLGGARGSGKYGERGVSGLGGLGGDHRGTSLPLLPHGSKALAHGGGPPGSPGGPGGSLPQGMHLLPMGRMQGGLAHGWVPQPFMAGQQMMHAVVPGARSRMPHVHAVAQFPQAEQMNQHLVEA